MAHLKSRHPAEMIFVTSTRTVMIRDKKVHYDPGLSQSRLHVQLTRKISPRSRPYGSLNPQDCPCYTESHDTRQAQPAHQESAMGIGKVDPLSKKNSGRELVEEEGV